LGVLEMAISLLKVVLDNRLIGYVLRFSLSIVSASSKELACIVSRY